MSNAEQDVARQNATLSPTLLHVLFILNDDSCGKSQSWRVRQTNARGLSSQEATGGSGCCCKALVIFGSVSCFR